jgi:iron-sulfur cluster insertion protein
MSDRSASSLELSAAAAARVQILQKRQGNPALMLRLSVDGGGCSGFSYRFGFDEHIAKDDTVVKRDGVTLLVDAISLPFLAGATVDYVEDLAGASFKIKNPNAASSCGCGTSFSI